jgi:hypothetical protein
VSEADEAEQAGRASEPDNATKAKANEAEKLTILRD